MSNDGEVHLNGNANWQVTGTILAPASDVTINGGSNGFVLRSQVIGYTVALSGSGTTTISYSDDQNYDAPIPPKVELTQ